MLNLIAGTYFHGYVSDIEMVWTLVAFAGAIFSIHNIMEARKDLIALRARNVHNGRWKIATTGFRAEIGRLVIQSIYLAVGFMAMTFQEPPLTHETLKVSLFRFLFQWGFIASGIILFLKSYWNYSLRRDLIEHGIKLEPHETEPGYKPQE